MAAETLPVDPLCHVETWVFDLDNTLYPASCNLFNQVDRRMGMFIAERLSLPFDQARAVQKAYFRSHGTTLRGLMVEHGIEPQSFLDYVHDIDITRVPPDPDLDAALRSLPGRKVVFTNASRGHAERVLERLGVQEHFGAIWDIAAADYIPKPEPRPYETLVEHLQLDARRAVMVEDIARNLEPAHALGMTTVWIATARAWGAPADGARHIDHRISDVTSWLTAVVAAREDGGRRHPDASKTAPEPA